MTEFGELKLTQREFDVLAERLQLDDAARSLRPLAHANSRGERASAYG